MDKIILEINDIFSQGAQNLNPIVLIPVTFVIVAVAVFMFGFKSTECPKFRNIVESNNNSANLKKKKRNVPTESTLSATTGGKSVKQSVQQVTQQKHTKKETPHVKAIGAPSKKSVAPNIPTEKKQSTKSGNASIPKSTKSKTSTKANVDPKVANEINDGEGEWQTVLTKKQKKQSENTNVASSVSNNNTKGKVVETKAQSPKKKANSEAKKEKHVDQFSNVKDEQPDVVNVTSDSKPVAFVVAEVIEAQETLDTVPPKNNLVFDELGELDFVGR